MADRIFPNKLQDKLDNKKIFNGINWDKISEQVKKLTKTSNFHDVPDDEAEEFAEWERDNPGGTYDDYRRMIQNFETTDFEDKDTLPEHALASKKKSSSKVAKKVSGKTPATKTVAKEKKEDFAKSKAPAATAKNSNNNIAPKVQSKRVISFTHPDQLSAEAVEAAIRSGDEELKNTILAARHQRRLALAAKIDQMRVAKSKKTTRVAADSDSKAIRTAQAQTIVDEITESNSGFKAVEDLSSDEKDTFARFAAKEGFPQEYVDYMLGGGEEPSDEALQIVELINNNHISKEAKVAAVKSMVKTAELSSKDLSYLRNYWINILGYDDPAAKEWVDALYSSKFNRTLSSEDEE